MTETRRVRDRVGVRSLSNAMQHSSFTSGCAKTSRELKKDEGKPDRELDDLSHL